MTAAPPNRAALGVAPPIELLYRVAVAGAAGESLDAVTEALLVAIAGAVDADRAVVVAAPHDDAPGRVLEPAWTAAAGAVPAPQPAALPEDEQGLREALGLPDALVVPLVAHGRRIGAILLGGTERLRLAERLAEPAALVLDPMLRAEGAAGRAERMERLTSLTRDLMSIVSHELRTPLTSIIGALQTLQRPGVDPAGPEARRLVDSALGRAERLRSLVEDLLITARPETPVRSKLRPVDVGATVRSAVAAIAGAEAVTTVEVDPGLGPVLVDGAQLERVVVNLVDNALRHGGGAVEVGAQRSGSQIEVTVVDHGPGLPPTIGRAVLDRSGDPEDANLRPAGPGLGLTITRGLVEGIGGTLTHRRTPGGGATFVVAFPFRDGR